MRSYPSYCSSLRRLDDDIVIGVTFTAENPDKDLHMSDQKMQMSLILRFTAKRLIVFRVLHPRHPLIQRVNEFIAAWRLSII